MQPRLLKAQTACLYCGVSRAVLKKHGPVPIKLGNKNFYDIRNLDAWIDSLSGVKASDAEQKALEALEDG
jgi:hypothetical protein